MNATATGTATATLLARWVHGMARGLAWAGGGVLLALVALSVLSIAGRSLSALGLGPVPGDFELVEAGTALAVLCFLPWCHLRRGHAVVDLLWRTWPPAVRRVLHVLAQALMLAVWLLLSWRLSVGMLDYRSHGETTFILRMPLWWAYAACLPPAAAGCVVYAWTLCQALGLAPDAGPDTDPDTDLAVGPDTDPQAMSKPAPAAAPQAATPAAEPLP